MRNKFIGVGSTVLAGLLIIAGLLFWNTPQQTAAAPQQNASVQAQVEGELAQIEGELGQRGPGRRGASVVASLVRTTAELSNIEVSAVREALNNGQSLAQIAAANGSSGDAVVQQVVANAKSRLDQAVAAGRLTQERANTMLTNLTDEATKLVNDTTLGQRLTERRERAAEQGTRGALIKATADATGLETAEIAQRLRDGESLSQIATAAGADPQAIISSAVDSFRATAEQVMNETR